MKIALIIITVMLIQGCGCHHNIQIFQQKLKPLNYFGVVKIKFIDSLDRGTPKVRYESGEEIPIYSYEMFEELLPGDTIIKKSGSLEHILKRNGETKIFYPKCDGKEIK